MTGFGAAEDEAGGRRVRIEIRTVNHRWFNLTSRLPADLASVESELRDALRRQFDRGHVNVQVRWVEVDADGPSIDFGRAEAVVAALRDLQRRLGLGGEVTVELVARQADIFGARSHDDGVTPWAAIAPVLATAAAECRASRMREGAVLAGELHRLLDALESQAKRIGECAPQRLERERDRLTSNMRQLVNGYPVDEARVASELAVSADRLDITEELVRFGAHLSAARAMLAGEQPMGKALGFLAQEMGREVNTMGAKAGDIAIAHAVVDMKGELEKVREQAENLE